MPGLYNNVANITVPDNDTVGLYQTGSNIAILNSAGALLSILDNSGNVHFQASPGGATVNASVTFAPYTNTNVAAYLPTDPTILAIQSTSAGLQTGLNTANNSIATLQSNVFTLDYNLQSVNNQITTINAELAALEAQVNYSNTNVAAYLPTDPTIITLQGNITTLTGNTIAQQNAITGLQNGLNSANTTLSQHTAQISTLQSGLNAANVSIGGLQLGLNSANTSLINLQSGLNSANITTAGVQTGLNTTNIALGNTIANVTILQTQVYSNTNVASYLLNSPANYNGNVAKAAQPFITSLGVLTDLTVNGLVQVNNQVTAQYFVGDGSGLTNLPVQSGTYSNSNVTSYLLGFNGTIGGNVTIGGDLTVLGNSIVIHEEIITGAEVVAGTMIANANITATSTTTGSLQVRGGAGITGAVFANNFVGDGSGLTGITASQIVNMYSNTNVAAYLPTYAGNIGTGAGYVFGNGYALTGLAENTALINLQNGINHANAEISGLQTGLNTANTNISNLQTQINEVNGFVTANALLITGLQTGLNSANANIVINTNNIANVQTGLNTANTTISGIQTGLNTANTTIAGVQTGLNTANTNISDLQTGLNTTNVTLGNTIANVTTLQSQVYTNSNVANFLTSYTGNLTAGNITATGSVGATYLYGNGYYLSGIGLDNSTLGYYGSFYDTTDQTNSGVTNRNLVAIGNTAGAKGVSIVDGSKITYEYGGTYQITVSVQLYKSDSGSDDVELWLSKNGVDVADTNSIFTLDVNNGKGIMTVQYIVSPAAGDYFQLWWHSADIDATIESIPAGTNPSRPAAPGVIVTTSQVTSVQLPEGNIILTGDATASGLVGSPTPITLANTGVTPGTYGNVQANKYFIPQITVDSKGRITNIVALEHDDIDYGNSNVAAYLPTDSTIIGIQTSITTANTTLAGLQTGLDTANASITTNANNIANVQTGLNTANGRITTLEGQVYANSNAVAYFSTYSGSLFHDLTITGNLTVNGATTTVNKEIVQTEEVVAGILTANANITSSSTGTGSLIVVGGVGISGDVYAATFNGDGVGITNLANNTAIQNIQTGLNSANTTISGVQTGLNTANTSISGLQTGLNTANTNISNNTSNITGLQTGLNTANSWIAANASMLVTTMSDVSGLMTNVITLQGQVYTNTNVAAYLPLYTGNLGNINNTGYVYGNGAFLTGLPATYSNTNVSNYLSDNPTQNISIIGNIGLLGGASNTGYITAAGSISAVGNIQSTNGYVLGNGAYLTGLPASYSNTQVAAYLPTYAGNIGTGAGYIYGNGYYLTGITSGGSNYSNSNVAAYLGNYETLTINITGDINALGGPSINGNISGYYFNGSGVNVGTLVTDTISSSNLTLAGSGQTRLNFSSGNARITDNSSSILMSSGTITLSHGVFGNVKIGNGTGTGNIMSNGSYALSLYAGGFTNSGVITLLQGANQNIIITPNGTGTTTVTNLTASEKVYAIGTTSGTITPVFSNGSVQTITLNGNMTLNGFTGSAGQTLTLIITQSASGNNTLTSTMKFAGGSKTLSTGANAIDIMSIFYDGTTYYASLSTGFA